MSKTIKFLIAILVFAAILRFWNLMGPDMQSDDALNSFRAFGYLDYVAAENLQSTPVTWFEKEQWWQKLSFHDHPPLVFAVQYIFFKIFGDNLFASRLPFVLAGLLSTFAIFLLGKILFNEKVGLLSAATLSLMSYHIWISRIGFLEGFVILFSILSLYFFARAKNNPKFYIPWGIVLGAGILSKYTFLFLLPVFGILILWERRKDFKQKWLWGGILIFVFIISPVIIYNIMVFKTRGHFDAALSSMLGMHPEDYKGLTRTVGGKETILSTVQSIKNNLSLGILMVFITGLFVLRNKVIWLSLISAFLVVSFAGGSDRFAVIIAPFMALVISHLIQTRFGPIDPSRAWGKLGIAVVVLLLSWEAIFAIQSQLLPEPILKNKFLYGGIRPDWAGFNTLEKFVKNFYKENPNPSYVIFAKTPQIINYQLGFIEKQLEADEDRKIQNHFLVYDDRTSWFPAVWIFERRRLYNAAAILALSQYVSAIKKEGTKHFKQYGFDKATIIITEPAMHSEDANKEAVKAVEDFVEKFIQKNQPVDEIKNYKKETIFKVYRTSL